LPNFVFDQIGDRARKPIGVSIHVEVRSPVERDLAADIVETVAHGLDQARQIDPALRAPGGLIAEKR
jgi:hypothetical protein